ncbi:MAG: hypothetical protein U0270_34595 [Labilithrix sp.]
MKTKALAALCLALIACKAKLPPAPDAGPAPVASEEVDANLPWATEIDMDAAAATASASASARPASAPAPAPAASAVAYTGPSGTYSGRVKDTGMVYTVTAQLGPGGGSVSYGPPLNCKGRWSQTSYNDKTARYVEKISDDPGKKCTPVVDVTLEKEESKPGSYWYSAGAGQAKALITKQ